MAYTPYYTGGWQSGEEGGTPITPAALNHMDSGIAGALPLSGGTMTGNIDMGQAGASSTAKGIQWTTTDGTVFQIRPYNNSFQLVRRPAGGASSGVLNIGSDGSISVADPGNWRTALGAAAASNVSDLVIKQSFVLTTSVSLNSLASASYDVTVTAPSGYKPVAALEGRVVGGLFAVTVNLIDSTTARAYVINASSSTRTGTGVTVDVLFIRDI